MTDQCSAPTEDNIPRNRGSLLDRYGSVFVVIAFLLPILPLMIVGAALNDSPALGGFLGLVIGVFAGGFLCGSLAILISIRSDVARIADAIESQSGQKGS